MSQKIDPGFVIGCIYDAVSEPGGWDTALEAARAMTEVDAMLLVYGYPPTSDLRLAGTAGFEKHSLEMNAGNHLNDDALIRESMNAPAGVIVSSGRSLQREAFVKTSLYRQLLRPSHLDHIAGAAVLNTNEIHASVWMARSDSPVDLSAHDTLAFSSLLPHFTRAMKVFHRIRQAESRTEMAEGAFDRLAVGVVLLDVRGAPVMVNREAEKIAAMKDGFLVLGNRLAADRMKDTIKLRDLIRRVGCNGPERTRVAAGTVRLVRPSGMPDFHVVALPLPKRCQPVDGSGAVTMLCITDPEKPQNLVDCLFGSFYGLTDAEVRLVTKLLEGGGLTAAAEKLRLSRNTVHSQLASVFLKTDTRSQSELLTLLLTCVAPVEPPDETSGFHMPAVDPG